LAVAQDWFLSKSCNDTYLELYTDIGNVWNVVWCTEPLWTL